MEKLVNEWTYYGCKVLFMNELMIDLALKVTKACSQVKRCCVVEGDAEMGVLKCEIEGKDKCS
jgi:hypothetical protein